MKRDDLPTVGYLDDCFRAILARLPGAPDAPLASGSEAGVPRLLTVEQVMDELHVSRRTVQRWLNTGKTGRTGAPIVLQAYYFSSDPRIPWPALAAFGQGLPFDLATLNKGAAPLAAAAPPKPLRVAS